MNSLIRYAGTRLSAGGEIQVKLPADVAEMLSRAGFDELLSNEGWLHTGRSGRLSPNGLIEQEGAERDSAAAAIEKKCHYLSDVLCVGNERGRVAILFPDAAHFAHPDYAITPMEGCFCPRNSVELAKCLQGCIGELQLQLAKTGPGISAFLVAGEEPCDNEY